MLIIQSSYQMLNSLYRNCKSSSAPYSIETRTVFGFNLDPLELRIFRIEDAYFWCGHFRLIPIAALQLRQRTRKFLGYPVLFNHEYRPILLNFLE